MAKRGQWRVPGYYEKLDSINVGLVSLQLDSKLLNKNAS
jgi:hypothetical protein